MRHGRSSRCRPIQTLPKRSAIGAWNSATSGLIAGNKTIGSASPNGESITFQSSRYFKTSEPISPRSGMKGTPFSDACNAACSAGQVASIISMVRPVMAAEARRRTEFAQADRAGFQRRHAAGADQQIGLQARGRQRHQMQIFDAAPDQRARRRHRHARDLARHHQHAAVGDDAERVVERFRGLKHAVRRCTLPFAFPMLRLPGPHIFATWSR